MRHCRHHKSNLLLPTYSLMHTNVLLFLPLKIIKKLSHLVFNKDIIMCRMIPLVFLQKKSSINSRGCPNDKVINHDKVYHKICTVSKICKKAKTIFLFCSITYLHPYNFNWRYLSQMFLLFSLILPSMFSSQKF